MFFQHSASLLSYSIVLVIIVKVKHNHIVREITYAYTYHISFDVASYLVRCICKVGLVDDAESDMLQIMLTVPACWAFNDSKHSSQGLHHVDMTTFGSYTS